MIKGDSAVILLFVGYAVAGLTFDILGFTWNWLSSGIYGYGGLGLVIVSIPLLYERKKK